MKNSSKTIVIIGPAWPLRGGIANFNERLARAFLSQGDKVYNFSFSLQYPKLLFPGKTQFSVEPAPGDLTIQSTINSINPISWIITGNKIRKLKPDLVVIAYWLPFMAPGLGTMARIIKRNKTSKLIGLIHNMIPHEKRPGDILLSRYFIKPMDGFVAMSKSVLEDLATFKTSTPSLFCPHPIYDNFGEPVDQSLAKKKLNLENDIRYLLFFGFIRDYKGLDLLIKAFGDPTFRGKKMKLLIAGEFYTDPQPYLDLIKEYNIDNEVVQCTDFIPDSEVKFYFSACDLVVQPYKNATQSGVTQIAYHFEKPMVTTNVGGLPEIVPDGEVGYVVAPEPAEIAKAIDKFFTENKKEEFEQKVKLEKQKFSWVKMVETIESLSDQHK